LKEKMKHEIHQAYTRTTLKSFRNPVVLASAIYPNASQVPTNELLRLALDLLLINASLCMHAFSHYSVDGAKCSFSLNHTWQEEIPTDIDKHLPSEPCVVSGRLRYSKNWYGYLATFRLRADSARLYYKFEYPEEKCCVKLLLYLQEQKNLLRRRMNCLQKESVVGAGNQVILLSPAHKDAGCSSNSTADDEERMITCSSGRELRSKTERDWFLAASSCGSPTGLHLNFIFQVYGQVGECPSGDRSGGTGVIAANIYLVLSALAAFLHH
jgi:hypothetical protein